MMNQHDWKLPENFSGEVRLFPLGDLVFFPHNVLPLHVFESRYREMIEDALDHDQLIAMATLLPGHEHDYYGRPPIAPSICIGRIKSCRRTEDGRFQFILLGLARATVEHEIEPVRSFRRAAVETIQEVHVVSESRSFRTRLDEHLLAAIPECQQLLDRLGDKDLSPQAYIDVLAYHLRLPTELKLQLLAEADVHKRFDVLIAYMASIESTRTSPGEFSDN